MPIDIKPGYDEDLIQLLYDDVQELKKAKTNRSGDIFKGDLLVDGNLIVKGKAPREDRVGQLYFGIDTETPENVLLFNGAPKLRSLYPELWAKVNAGKLGSVVTDTVWSTPASLACGSFSSGDRSTTFKMPDWNGLFMRFTGSNSVLKTANGIGLYDGGTLLQIMKDMMLEHFHEFFGGINIQSGFQGAPSQNYNNINTNKSTWVQVKNAISDSINGTPNTGPENRPVSGSKIAFIYAED